MKLMMNRYGQRTAAKAYTRGNSKSAESSQVGQFSVGSNMPQPLRAWELRTTSPEVVAEIDRLLDFHVEAQIPTILNEHGLHSAEGKPFHSLMVKRIRRAYRLKPPFDRLREAGMLTVAEMATSLGASTETVKKWSHYCSGMPTTTSTNAYTSIPATIRPSNPKGKNS
jgi:hypothetical protein